jgi:imidazolonepropionase-like amidohydrolase
MTTIFTGGPAFIGDGTILDHATVIVEGEKIVKVASQEVKLPRDAELIDLKGKMLLPGFVDCHTHIMIDGSPDPLAAAVRNSLQMTTLLAAAHAKNTLMAGVTTARDMGGTGNVDIAIRDAIKNCVIRGPRMLVSGLQICMTGGHGWEFGREADGPDEVRKAAREQIKAGCDIVKLMATGGIMTPGVEPGAAQFTEEEISAGVEEAHKANRKSASHAQGTKGILNSLKAGIDTIEHGFFLNEECVSLMVKNNVPLIPTLAGGELIEKAANMGIPDFIVEKNRQVLKAQLQSLAMAREAGIMIGMGADCGTPLLPHGSNLLELVSLAEIGFTTEEVLTIGTLNGAKILGLEQQIGSIEEGKLADLVVVEGNPVDDINLVASIENISTVMQSGSIVKF